MSCLLLREIANCNDTKLLLNNTNCFPTILCWKKIMIVQLAQTVASLALYRGVEKSLLQHSHWSARIHTVVDFAIPSGSSSSLWKWIGARSNLRLSVRFSWIVSTVVQTHPGRASWQPHPLVLHSPHYKWAHLALPVYSPTSLCNAINAEWTSVPDSQMLTCLMAMSNTW